MVGNEEFFEVNASTSDGTFFNTEINLKEIRLKKTSECFVQWRNRKSKNAWGLNFISEEEAKKFLDFCYHARIRTWSFDSSSTSNQQSHKNSPLIEARKISHHSNDKTFPHSLPHGTLTHNKDNHHGSSDTLVSEETSSHGNMGLPQQQHGQSPKTKTSKTTSGSYGNFTSDRHGNASPRSHGNNSPRSYGDSSHSRGNSSPRSYGNSSPRFHGNVPRHLVHSSGSVGTNSGRVSSSSGNNGHDSGFGVEEEGSESTSDVFTRPVSQASSSFERWSSFSSEVDPALETSLNESGLEDSVEREYFNEMKKMHRGESVEISATFHDDDDLVSSSGTDADLKPRSGIAHSRQGGATRKAGWLSAKHVLTRGKGGKIDLASDRKWRKYWITLKSANLNFYQCNEKTVSAQDLDDPSFGLEIESCIAQAVPEHAKLDHVFSVSTRLGEAYYFQAANQTDLENWITAVHSMAASLLTGSRQKSKDEMVKTLMERVSQVDEKIASDSKLKKMAELQSTVVTDSKMKQQFLDQISRWEKSLEQHNITTYRLQCYMSAVKGSPQPNPQTLLACVSRTTKQSLSRLGIFSVMSFYAVANARDPTTEEEVKARNKAKRSPSNIGYNKIKSKIFTSLRLNDASSVKSIRDRYANKNTAKGRNNFKRSNLQDIPDNGEEDTESRSLSSSHSEWRSLGNYLRISLPSNQSTVIALSNEMTVQDVVVNTCEKRQLDPRLYFLKLGVEEEDGTIDYGIPRQDSLLEDQNYTHLKLSQRCVYKVELTKSLEVDGLDFGLSVDSKDGVMYISHVEKGRLAHVQGVQTGDEILSVNDVPVSDVETNPLQDLKEALQDSCITLELRSPRDEPPVSHKVTSDAIISSLVIKPPPKLSDNINDTELVDMIVPPPIVIEDDGEGSTVHTPEAINTPEGSQSPQLEHKTVDELLQQAEQVTIFCRQQLEYSEDDVKHNVQLTDADKLRKVIVELYNTERSYVKDLKLLLNRYLDPLKDESFMSQSEVKALVGTVDEILDFQKKFLQELNQAIDNETGFENFTEISQFQNVIYTIGETFLNYTEHFKLYSAFCSSHSRLVELLSTGQNEDLRNFLNARNPKNQHSGTLESYLIKPIQRILRYPLLMRTILKMLDKNSEEHEVLLEAVNAVEKVASHINEMQRITERFAPIFNQIVGDFECVEVSDVTIDRLLHHGKATWLNCPDEPRSGTLRLKYPSSPRIHKKVTNSVMHIFVFEKVVILIHIESKSRKKEKSSSVKTAEEIKLKTLIPVTSLVLRDHRWATDDTLHSWELVNISDTTELGRQECNYIFASKSTAEQREAVKSIKEAIKKSIKTGSTVTTIRSHSFRRSETNGSSPSLNSTFPVAGNSNFLRSQPDVGLLRRSFSHNPEEALTRRTSLLEDQHSQIIQTFKDHSPCYSDDDDSSIADRVSVVVKDEPAKPVDMGTI